MTSSPDVHSPCPADEPLSYEALGALVHEVGTITLSTSHGPVVCLDGPTYARLTQVPTPRKPSRRSSTTDGDRATRDDAADLAPAQSVRLTAREKDLLRAVAAGDTMASAAAQRGLAVNTVAQHLASIRRKYRVRATVDAVHAARADGELR